MYESSFGSAGETFEYSGETGSSGEWESGESEFGEGEFESSQETLEAELAAELLEISSEAELDRFLGSLAKSVVKGASSLIKSPIGKALGGVLKNVAKVALPAVGGALGSMVLPGAGTMIGSKLGSLAGGLLEAGEAEAMGEAEAEFEAAQRYVRFARAAWSNAARAPRDLPARSVARAASISAARRYAPTLLRDGDRMSPWRRRRAGYGYRQQPARWRGYQQPPWYGDPDPGGYSGGYYGSGDDASDEPAGPWSSDGGSWGESEGPGGRSGGSLQQRSGGPGQRPSDQRSEGRWIRRRNRIILLGV